MEMINTLHRGEFLKKVPNENAYMVNLDLVTLPNIFRVNHNFTHVTKTKASGFVKIWVAGDDLFIGGKELDELLDTQSAYAFPTRLKSGDSVLDGYVPHISYVPEHLEQYVYLHPAFGLALYHLKDRNFIPKRYVKNKEGLPMRICFKGAAFRYEKGERGESFWLLLNTVHGHLEADFILAKFILPNLQRKEEWVPLVV